jgi:predicted nuclease with TOPRIM domain
LKNIISRQRQLLSELESEQKSIEATDIIKENEKLKSELRKLRADVKKTEEKSSALSDENSRLRNSLYGQIYNEKVKIVEASERKLIMVPESNTPK